MLKEILPNTQLHDLFTVVIEMDLQLKITSVSPLLHENAPEVCIGSEMTDVFDMVRPSRVDKNTLASRVNLMYLMVSKESRYPIRGQLVFSQHDNKFILLGSPWLSRLESDKLHTYELQDFPPHDAQLDWLFMLSSEQQRVRDLEELSSGLKMAKADAEKAHATKSSFFAVMSHEMRTPLNAVIGAMNLLKDEELSSKQKELLQMGLSASHHLLTVINDVLDLSKIEADKMSIENSVFHTHEMLDDIKSICHSRALGKSLVFNTYIQKDVPKYIRADDGKIKQILINLISNAIKFTDEGSVEVQIEMLEKQGATDMMKVSIIDTGRGISDANKDKLFNEFWSSNTGSDYYAEGTGLGLDIAKRLVHLLDGSIDFESTEGVGSTFWIEIPVEVAEKPESVVINDNKNIVKNNTFEENEFKNVFSGKKALLAEDNQANQLIGRLNLERMGFTVDIANNGLEVIDLVNSHSYDIVLMDIGMPVMDGVEATAYLRSELEKSELPIIACTAHSFSNDIQQLVDKGFTDYIPKPISRSNLLQVISKWLTKSPGTAEEYDPAASLNETINKDELDQLMEEVGSENAHLMLDAFLTELDKRIVTIVKAKAENDLTGIFDSAHALKSTAFSYGANKLGELLSVIESGARNGNDVVLGEIEKLYLLSDETRKSIIKLKNQYH